jgi:hypothetical protein
MNAKCLPLAALILGAGALADRFVQKRTFAGIARYGLAATAIGSAPSFAPLIVDRSLQGLREANLPARRPFGARAGLARRQESPCGRHLVRRRGCRQRRRARDRRRDSRSRALADDLSDAPARSRRRAGRRQRVDTQGHPDQPRQGRGRCRCFRQLGSVGWARAWPA